MRLPSGGLSSCRLFLKYEDPSYPTPKFGPYYGHMICSLNSQGGLFIYIYGSIWGTTNCKGVKDPYHRGVE